MTKRQTHEAMNDDTRSEPSALAQPPGLITIDGALAPRHLRTCTPPDLDPMVVSDLALKAAYTVPQFTAEWAARRLHLPQALLNEVFEQLRTDHMLEVLGQAGPFGFRYAITNRGRERASRLMEISGYIGPAPVSLETYTAMLEWQLAHAPEVTPKDVADALAELVLRKDDALLAGLAALSSRSLFRLRPTGQRQDQPGPLAQRRTEAATSGSRTASGSRRTSFASSTLSCIKRVEVKAEEPWAIDQRWVRIRRPLIVGGSEMTLGSFDLVYSQSMRYYEAPLHLKANGGTFLIDDYGRQTGQSARIAQPLDHPARASD